MDLKDNGDSLAIGGLKIKFNYPIIKTQNVKDFIIVQMKDLTIQDDLEQPANNIVGIDFNGKKVWSILKLTNCYAYYPNFKIINNEGINILLTQDLFGIQYSVNIDELKLIDRKGICPIKFVADWRNIRIDDKVIKFDNDITKVAQMDNLLIVHLKDMSTDDVTKQPTNNIMAINRQGKILWKIGDITNAYNIPYNSFDFQKRNGKIMLITRNCAGIEYTIDLVNLTVIHKEGHRF